MRKRTKIICTIGPASRPPRILEGLVRNGMNIARFNFSHQTHEEALENLKNIRSLREKLDIPLPVILDTKGPEVRLYGYAEEIALSAGDSILIESYSGDDIRTARPKDKNHFFTNLPDVTELGKAGARVLLMDGFIEGEITDKTEESLVVKLRNGGVLRPRAHFAMPKVDYHLEFLSDKDREDIEFAIGNEFEYIALSFVGSADDVLSVRELIRKKRPRSRTLLISKIENRTALGNLKAIIEASDGIMVARGDLGVELDMAEVPIAQKKIIQMCYRMAKPVITATQMLESMVEKPIPTRAEASDVANACFDLTSAVMLSGETAVGNYPEEVVRTMSSIIGKVEEELKKEQAEVFPSIDSSGGDQTAVINSSAVSIARVSGAKAIIVVTKSGYSARMLSKIRPMIPIWAFTYDEVTYHQLELNWGIIPFIIAEETSFETMVDHIKKHCLTEKIARQGDRIVIVGGLPLGKTGTTNMVRVEML